MRPLDPLSFFRFEFRTRSVTVSGVLRLRCRVQPTTNNQLLFGWIWQIYKKIVYLNRSADRYFTPPVNTSTVKKPRVPLHGVFLCIDFHYLRSP